MTSEVNTSVTVLQNSSPITEYIGERDITEDSTDPINVTIYNGTTVRGYSPLLTYYPYIAAEMGISILCLLIVIFVYCCLREYRSVPGRNVISLSCCLIVCYSFLIVDVILRGRIPRMPCVIIALTIHITFLATFFWTNVMSYDIMHTMASVRPSVVFVGSSTRYWKYAAYAWSLTLLCAIPAIVIDYSEIVPVQYRPQFGHRRCWLSGTPAFLLYFNGPVGVILLSNCLLFIITARTIIRIKNATAILEAKRHKKRFRLYIKLVLVMGLVWFTEFIPWITGIYKLYAIAGILSSLHGVFMFLIFVCKIRIWRQMAEFFHCYGAKKKKSLSTYVGRQLSPSITTLTTTTSISSG